MTLTGPVEAETLDANVDAPTADSFVFFFKDPKGAAC